MTQAISTAIVASLLVGCAVAGPPPLPPDSNIVPPAASVPAELAAFSGKWSGAFHVADRELDHVLVVEEVRGSDAVVIFSFGTRTPVHGFQPAWARYRATLEDGTLRINEGGTSMVYRVQSDGSLVAQMEKDGIIHRARLTRGESRSMRPALSVPSDVSLPADLAVTRPSAGVPANLAAISGRWVGALDGRINHVLVVEEASDATSLTVVVAFGGAPGGESKPGWVRVRASFADGVLRVSSRDLPFIATYRVQPDGSLAGVHEGRGRVYRATMRRID